MHVTLSDRKFIKFRHCERIHCFCTLWERYFTFTNWNYWCKSYWWYFLSIHFHRSSVKWKCHISWIIDKPIIKYWIRRNKLQLESVLEYHLNDVDFKNSHLISIVVLLTMVILVNQVGNQDNMLDKSDEIIIASIEYEHGM